MKKNGTVALIRGQRTGIKNVERIPKGQDQAVLARCSIVQSGGNKLARRMVEIPKGRERKISASVAHFHKQRQ